MLALYAAGCGTGGINSATIRQKGTATPVTWEDEVLPSIKFSHISLSLRPHRRTRGFIFRHSRRANLLIVQQFKIALFPEGHFLEVAAGCRFGDRRRVP